MEHMTDPLDNVRAALAAGDVRQARALLEKARGAYHRGTGENPHLLEMRVAAAEEGADRSMSWGSRRARQGDAS